MHFFQELQVLTRLAHADSLIIKDEGESLWDIKLVFPENVYF